jgi:hypothetical protein
MAIIVQWLGHEFVVKFRNLHIAKSNIAVYNKYMPQTNCKQCGKEFYTKPSWIRNGFGKYCSKKCGYESRKKGKIVDCFVCSKKIYKSCKAIKGSKSRKYFCSKSCQTIWRNKMVFIGKNHANWKGGHFTYRNILLRSKIPRICKLCGEEDNRILLVHHVDTNNKNNEMDNLIWLCHNCHFLVHHYSKTKEDLDKIILNKKK